jgi:circadian clock protein KaiB
MPTVPRKRRIRSKKKFVLKLYVTGATRRSQKAITALTSLREEYSNGCIELEVLDVYQLPLLTGQAGIMATPTLVKELPLPVRHAIGDFSERKTLLMLLGLQHRTKHHG